MGTISAATRPATALECTAAFLAGQPAGACVQSSAVPRSTHAAAAFRSIAAGHPSGFADRGVTLDANAAGARAAATQWRARRTQRRAPRIDNRDLAHARAAIARTTFGEAQACRADALAAANVDRNVGRAAVDHEARVARVFRWTATVPIGAAATGARHQSSVTTKQAKPDPSSHAH